MSLKNQSSLPRGRTEPFPNLSRKPRLIPEIIRDHIRHSVFDDELSRASELLLEITDLYAPEKMNEMILIHRRIVEIEKIARIHTEDFEVISRERNRLGLAILELVDTVCFS